MSLIGGLVREIGQFECKCWLHITDVAEATQQRNFNRDNFRTRRSCELSLKYDGGTPHIYRTHQAGLLLLRIAEIIFRSGIWSLASSRG